MLSKHQIKKDTGLSWIGKILEKILLLIQIKDNLD